MDEGYSFSWMEEDDENHQGQHHLTPRFCIVLCCPLVLAFTMQISARDLGLLVCIIIIINIVSKQEHNKVIHVDNIKQYCISAREGMALFCDICVEVTSGVDVRN